MDGEFSGEVVQAGVGVAGVFEGGDQGGGGGVDGGVGAEEGGRHDGAAAFLGGGEGQACGADGGGEGGDGFGVEAADLQVAALGELDDAVAVGGGGFGQRVGLGWGQGGGGGFYADEEAVAGLHGLVEGGAPAAAACEGGGHGAGSMELRRGCQRLEWWRRAKRAWRSWWASGFWVRRKVSTSGVVRASWRRSNCASKRVGRFLA